MTRQIKNLRYYAGSWKKSVSKRYMDCYNPSTGEVIARTPQCTPPEVEEAVAAARAAFPHGRSCPATSGSRSYSA